MYPLMISVDSPFKSSVVSIDYNVELEEDNVQLRDIVKKQKKKAVVSMHRKIVFNSKHRHKFIISTLAEGYFFNRGKLNYFSAS